MHAMVGGRIRFKISLVSCMLTRMQGDSLKSDRLTLLFNILDKNILRKAAQQIFLQCNLEAHL